MKAKSVIFYLGHPIHALGKVVDKFYRIYNPDIPWITPQSVKVIERLFINGNLVGFEWGSGTSTQWFSKYCKELHSVEYDSQWYQIVEEMIAKDKDKKIFLYHIPLEHPKSMPTYPSYAKSPQYVSKISDFPEQYFDFILVDGHYRQACVIASDKHLRKNGYLIIDNYNRIKTKEQWGVPSNYTLVHLSSNIVTTTAIFQKK